MPVSRSARPCQLKALLLFVAIVAAACASSDDQATSTGAASTVAVEASATVPAAATSTPTAALDVIDEPPAGDSSGADEQPMASLSPIGAFFADDGSFEATYADFRIRLQEAIVVCMAEQGFEYVAPPAAVRSVIRLQAELSERDWVTEYGYGISTSFDSVSLAGFDDPNGAIVAALSEAERELWTTTLRGENAVEIVGGGLIGPGSLEDQGCAGQAVIDTGAQAAFDGLERFGQEYAQGEFALQGEPEMVDAIQAWSRCMSEAGHQGQSTLYSPQDRIGAEFRRIAGQLGEALAAIDPADGQAFVAGDSAELPEIAGFDVDELRQVQADERAIALADLDCRLTHVRPIYGPLLAEFEHGLLETFGSELDALRTIGSDD